jgi:sugar lactone lactonase YvrE
LTTLLLLLSVAWPEAPAAEKIIELAKVKNPYGLVQGPDKKLYICSIDDHKIYRLDLKSKKLDEVVTGQNEPYEVRFDKQGNLFFVDMKAHVVKRRDKKTGALTVVAGTGEPGFSGDGGPANKAQLNQPHAIQFDPQGRLLICDIRNNRIRRVDLKTGLIETWMGNDDMPVKGPRAIDFSPDGTLWLALREGNAVWKVDYATRQHTVLADKLHGPKGIVWSAKDKGVYIADTESHEVTFLDGQTGARRVVADKLKRPHGVALNLAGQVLVGDSENHRVIQVDPH